mgnify:CR=1 FL=1
MAVGGTGRSVFSFPTDMGATDRSGETGEAMRDLPLPPRLQGTLERFRERLWSVKIAEGALAGLLGLGISYLLVFGLDRFFDTPAWLRASLLVAGFAVPALGLPLLWHRWVWRQRTLADAARYLKRRHPRLGDELLGIVELAHHHPGDQSQPLIEAAMRQIDERVADRDFSDAVPTRRYGRRLVGALATLALAGLLLAFVSDAARNTLARWVSPWRGLDRYTFAQLETVPETLVVPYAEPFPLDPRLAATTEWRPGQATLRLPGKTRLSAPREEDRYAFAVPPQKEAGTLSLRVGDARERISVEPLPRPELASLEALVRLPDYLRYENDPVVPVRGNTLTLLEGSVATIRGTTTRELASAEGGGEPARIEGSAFSSAPFRVETPQTRTYAWKDVHGLEAKRPLELNLTPVSDQAPELYAHQVEPKRMVLEDEVVAFDIRANDDFGLREVGLEWRPAASSGGEATEALPGEKPISAGAPEKTSIQTRGTFSAKREGIHPGTYQVRAFAADFFPNRQRVFSPAFVLHILSPQEHARWLTEEFSKWFRNARETYEREQQLHESNLALRELSAEELDRPENRRRLQDQASAESANARRLDALASAGRGLVGEATKNPEFDAERLERWAAMMRALDEIARERMPTVADLLQQASRAPGGATSPSEENPPEKTPTEGDTPPSSPTLGDQEKGMDKEKPDGDDSAPADSPPAPLRLPTTTLTGGGDAGAKAPPAETPAQKTFDRALEEQEKLLEEFARVTDELREILASLEASTFVKRLKAASRKQTEIADTLSKTLDGGFGLPRQHVEQRLRETGEAIAKEQEAQSRFVHHIQTDLEAYFHRKQDTIYKNVLDQMKEDAVVPGLRRVGEEALANLRGRSVAASQFWADTLDRWAEELVAAAPPQEEGQGQQGESKSLPPELVLRIMKVLQGEMQLRDETREMEEVRPALAPDVYASKVRALEYTQTDLRERVDGVVEDIIALPDARDFGREIQLLALVSDVMRQAHAVLFRPDTGPEAVAYETEAIELLLQSKRQQSGGGSGGGGSSNPGGGSQGGGKGSALSDVGPQDTAVEGASPLSREVEQSTGKAGRELPEEFRRGLDSYFNELESN